MATSTGQPGALRRSDVLYPLLLILLACWVTVFVFNLKGATNFYQNWAAESVAYACGHGLSRLNVLPETLERFLMGVTRSFDCADLPQDGYGPPGYWAQVQPALTWAAALSWRTFGVTQSAMLPLLTLLMAAYVAGCYAFSRLFLSPHLSALAGAVIAISGPTTALIWWLRDFSKAPFFVWAVVFLLIAIRTRRPGVALLAACAAGAVTGIGTSFRVDLLILLPFGLVLLVVAALIGPLRGLGRVLPILAFALVTLFTALPVVSHISVERNSGTLVMQGMAEPFRDRLRLAPAGYALAWEYSDELTLSEVAAVQSPTMPDWEGHSLPPGYAASDAYSHAGAYLFGWADMFAADFATQALKSAAWTAWMPAYYQRSLNTNRKFRPDLPYIGPLYRTLGLHVPVAFGIFCFCMLILQQFPNGRGQAILTAFFLIMITGYTGIQSSLRHVFHLEIIWLVGLLCLFRLPTHWPAIRAELRPFVLFVILTSAGVFAALTGLSAWQQAQLSGSVATLLDGPRTTLPLTRTAADDARLRLPIPAEHRPITDGPQDSHIPAVRFVGLQSYTFAAGARALVTIGGQDCPATPFALGLDYALDKDVWLPFSSTIQITQTDTETRQALIPIFWRPTQHFDSFVLPESHAACTLSAEKLEADSRLPLIFSAQIDGTGIVGPWHKGFGDFDRIARSPGPMRETRPDA